MERKSRRVVFALTPKIRKSFLPRFDRASFFEMDDVWVDVAGIETGSWEHLLRENRSEVIVSGWSTPPIPREIIGWPETSLRYVCHLAGSIRSVVSRELVERGLLVTNWGSSISHTIAEHAILLVLGSLRCLPLWRSCIDASSFGSGVTEEVLHTRSLKGKRVGIHGFGAIAREIVSRLKPFGVIVSAYSAGVPLELYQQHGVRRCSNLEELFTSSEVLIECEALTLQTAGSVNESLLHLLPEDAVFVNVGRGAVVDEDALARLASAGKIRIALDVFRTEPLPFDSALRQISDSLLSPHCAGPTEDTLPLCGDFAMENLRRYLSGNRSQMQGVVTSEMYDRIT